MRKLLRAAMRRSFARQARRLHTWLEENAPGAIVDEAIVEQKHLDSASHDRAFWHHGHMIALRDALVLLRRRLRLH